MGGGWEAADQELQKKLEQAAFKALDAVRLIGDDKTCSTFATAGAGCKASVYAQVQSFRSAQYNSAHAVVKLAVCGLRFVFGDSAASSVMLRAEPFQSKQAEPSAVQ
jgi:hypothetical protein